MVKPVPEFTHYCCDLLASVGPCQAKPMFGGWGLSVEGLSVAILADLGSGETLWLKADETSKAAFEAVGCQRFTYPVKGELKSMNYYSAPSEAMDSAALMQPWARLALQAALAARAAKPAKPKRPAVKKTNPRPAPTSP